MAEDIDKLVKWAEANGWIVKISADGYRRFHRPDGTYVGHYPATPSNPRGRLADIVGRCRANGLAWPAPSKKEQRAQRRKEEER